MWGEKKVTSGISANLVEKREGAFFLPSFENSPHINTLIPSG